MRSAPFFTTVCAAFAVLTLVAGAPDLIDYDSTQFALALEQQDLRYHQPQPPGFILFVWFARLVKAFVGDAYVALRIVSITLLIAAAWFLRRLATEAYDRSTARIAVLLFFTSPLVLFHGMTTMIYPAEALIAAVVGYFAFRALHGTERDLRLLAFLVGILAGVRQTAVIFAIPLLLVAAWRGRYSRHAYDWAALAWCLGVLTWLLPQFRVSGGLGGYLHSNLLLQSHLFAKSPFHEGMLPLEDHLRRGMNVLLMGLGFLRLLYVMLGVRKRPPGVELAPGAQPSKGLDRSFYLAWLVPPLLLFILYHFPKSGYSLALWPGLTLGLAHVLRSRGVLLAGNRFRTTAFATFLAVDVLLFFFLPTAHIGREPWDLPNAVKAEGGVPTLAGPSWWKNIDSAPGFVRRPAKLFLGRVDFFFDRTRGFKFGGFLAALRAEGFPRDDTLLIGQDAVRVVCYGLPDQPLIHVDPVRPEPFLSYRSRRATRIGESLVIEPQVRWLLIEGPADSIRFEGSELPQSRRDLAGPLANHFQLLEIGTGSVRASYRPRGVAGTPPIQLELFRVPTGAAGEPVSEVLR